ncbi:hypothetical protein [Pseudoduganella sp. OTU4001]|uniref:hypothetical protein n=1 Tax=Pseudoduganella sp. OTU4001 TaxID=3043854 RepID=UPI00313E4089
MRTLIRLALSAVCLFFMVGFGLCGLAGVAISFESRVEPGLLALAAVGLGIAAVCGFAVYRIWNPKS